MKRVLSHVYRVRRLAVFFIFAVCIFLLIGHSSLLVTSEAVQAGWRIEIEQGQKARLNVSIDNICKEPHLYGIKNKFTYLSMVDPIEAVLVGPDSTELVGFDVDATGLEIGLYRDSVSVDCLDCNKVPECQNDHNKLLVEISVVKSKVPTELLSTGSPRTQTRGSVLNRSALTSVPCCTPPPSGMVSWWPMDGSVVDITDGNNPTPASMGGVNFAGGMVDNGVTFAPFGFIEIKQSDNLSNQRFTLDAWVRPDGPGPNDDDEFGSDIIVKSFKAGDQSAGLLYNARTGRFLFIFGNIHTERILSTHQFSVGSFYHVAGTYDGAAFRLYVNGQLEGQKTSGKTIKYSAIPWAIGSSAAFARLNGFPRTWNGVIDEVEVFNRALCASEIQTIYIAASAGKCKP